MSARLGEPASRCLGKPTVGASRFVGDPIDIVTGAVVDEEVDFRLPRAALALSWVRRFDSRQVTRDRGLGLGFRHELDRELRFDLDGMTYVDAAWDITSFPILERDGQRSLQRTLSLERIEAMRYRVHEPDGRSYEFAFTEPDEPARLERVLERERVVSLHYERVTGREQLSAVGLGMLGRLRMEWSQGRISRISLSETEPERETELATYRYDERGCLVEARNAYKHSLRYVFDEQRRLTQKTDRRGYSFHFTYDAAGRCVESRGEDGAEAVKLEYRPIERATTVTRHDGGKWLYQYNDAGTILYILDPYEGAQSFVLDERGRVREEVDALGNSLAIEYDARGVAVAKLDAFGHRTALPEDPSVPHPLEHRLAQTPLEWEFGTLFEAPPRLPVTGDPLWDVPFQARPLIQTAEVDWGGHTHLQRNLQGLPTRELREDSKARRWAFDENANVRAEVDFDGHKRAFEYASDNHLVREYDALGHITRYERSPTEKLTALTDSGGTRSTYVLDLKDRVIEVHRHGRVRERYVYDAADNLIEKRTEAGELLLEMTIGPGNRKVARKLGSGEIQTFDYDERGRLTEARGAAGSCTFSYAVGGARLSDLRAGRGVEHTRDFAGVSTTTLFGRFTTRYHRGRAGDVSLVDPTGRSHTLSRLALGIYQRKLSSGAREVSQFDGAGRCLAKGLYLRADDDRPWLRGFRYSGEGDLVELSDSQRGTTRFAYDAAHRLHQVTHPNKRVDAYAYDSADNLLSVPSAVLEARALGESDRLDVQSGNRLRAARGERFDYDDRDHVRCREFGGRTTYYRRDALDQLIEIRGPDYLFQAKYDPLGRRTEKTVNGATTTYHWDSDRLTAELLPNGNLRVYVYASDLALVPALFVDYVTSDAEPESGTVFYVVSNHLGAVELVLNDASETVWSAQLDPYGLAHVAMKQPFHQPLRFPGHFFDAETGLHYNRFRYYDPKLGRYLESDPIGIEGGVNLYAHTTNPLREVDVRGLAPKCPNGKDCPKRKKASEEDPRGAERTDPNVEPKTASPLPKLPRVSARELQLAAGPENTSAAQAAREKVLIAFLAEHGREWDAAAREYARPTPDQIRQQLNGHDLTRPVKVGPPPPCPAIQAQWQRPKGNQGSYYADPGTSPDKIGIAGHATDRDTGVVVRKVSKSYTVQSDATYLESTAAPTDDKWSIDGLPVPTSGGGTQRVIGDRSSAKETVAN